MIILNDFNTTVCKALDEIDSNWRNYEGLIVCGTHSPKDVENQLEIIRSAREAGVPFLGICFGHQLAAIEYARNVLGIKNATSEEFGENKEMVPVVIKLPELHVGLGSDGESYWNNYVVVDMILNTWKKNDNFITCQFHPEYQSSKDKQHPLLVKFIKMAKEYKKEVWQCRWAPTLGQLENTALQTWGTIDYFSNGCDKTKPTVFMGLYGFPDFFALWRHKVRKAILWCGSDILHFLDGYYLDGIGDIKMEPKPLAKWISKNCENYVENEIEQGALLAVGIESKVVPSFLGNVDDFKIMYKQSDKPKLYSSVSGNDFKKYGWNKIPELARANPDVEFHLFGNTAPFSDEGLENIFVWGRVSKEQMNNEIEDMQGALRLVEFDGFSEIVAKSLLMGQWPVSCIHYPHTLPIEDIGKLKNQKFPNMKGREWLLGVVNKYPWNENV